MKNSNESSALGYKSDFSVVTTKSGFTVVTSEGGHQESHLTMGTLENLGVKELTEKISVDSKSGQMECENLFATALKDPDFPPLKKVDILQVLMRRNMFINPEAETSVMLFVEDSDPTTQEIVYMAQKAI